MNLRFFLCFILIVNVVRSGRILGIIPTASYSHQVAFWPLWKELSLRGHQVTVMTTNPINDPSLTNLTEIDLSFSYKIYEQHDYHNRLIKFSNNFFNLWNLFAEIGEDLNEIVFSHSDVRNLIDNKTIDFDIVMIEYLNPSFYPFAYRFRNSSFIAIVSLEASTLAHECLGNPAHPVLNPDFTLPFSENLSLSERVISSLVLVFMKYYNLYMYRALDKSVEHYYERGYPPIEQFACSMDMLFMNTNPIFSTIRPLVPATIAIGGGNHIRKSQTLPKVLKP